MDGFDTVTMSYLAAPITMSNVNPMDPLQVPLLPLDQYDHRSNYDADTFAG